ASNVLQGAALAAEREPDVVVFDGSGAALPPVDVDARILVTGRGHDPLAYLNPYRVLISDAVVLVGGGDAGAVRELKRVPVVEAASRRGVEVVFAENEVVAPGLDDLVQRLVPAGARA